MRASVLAGPVTVQGWVPLLAMPPAIVSQGPPLPMRLSSMVALAPLPGVHVMVWLEPICQVSPPFGAVTIGAAHAVPQVELPVHVALPAHVVPHV
jgi:hypothetical protein